jgi:UDP-N-acetylglucosamine 2-epimerase (non-hydrolysing)
MKRAHLILTDSGGIQEEAPSHGVPVLVLRQSTERPEAVDAGLAILTGTDREEIVEMASRLLQDTELHARMRDRRNPFGDGNAGARIAKALYRFVRDDYPLLTTQEQFNTLRRHADRRSHAGELSAGVRTPEPKRVHDDCGAEAAK